MDPAYMFPNNLNKPTRAISVKEEKRIPLYSTSWENFASQAVARKLKLINYGMGLHID